VRTPWGEDFVFSKADLENQDILLSRLKNTFPVRHMRMLSKADLEQVRATIYPVVEIEVAGRPPFILDEQQEKIVAEPVRSEPQATLGKKAQQAQERRRQEELFESLKVEQPEEMPVGGERISQNIAIRLVRGFSGSGKTLVLMQRARFLAAQYPEWKIGVLTYNKPLQQQLEQTFKGTTIQARTFHSLCNRLCDTLPQSEIKLQDWLSERVNEYPIIRQLTIERVSREIDWLRDMGITTLEAYLLTERRGVGKDVRLSASDRRSLYQVYEAYRNFLRETNAWDWPEMPLMALQALEKRPLKEADLYDALLVDEAQDWAPVWFKVITKMVHPEHGLIFLADDPSQSIYRYFSWKEKGINVVGRTRWLRVPYRNTYEIYRAAYSLIADQAEIQQSLAEEGEIVAPELSSQTMRHGLVPLVRRCKNQAEELNQIKAWVDSLCREGYREKQIAVLARYKRDMEPIQNALRGTGVETYMIHSYKGLEAEVVIIPNLQNTFLKNTEMTSELRLLYMAMSRARSRLYLSYSGRLPPAYDVLRKQNLADFLE
jgi:superfamily I DNA/RNA helicase